MRKLIHPRRQCYEGICVTASVKEGGKREIAWQTAMHESLLSTELYDRGDDDVVLAEYWS